MGRQEEKMTKAVESAESEGRDAVDGLQRENAVLQTRKTAAVERRVAAEKDRTALFAEAQAVEREVRDERGRKAEAATSAAPPSTDCPLADKTNCPDRNAGVVVRESGDDCQDAAASKSGNDSFQLIKVLPE